MRRNSSAAARRGVVTVGPASLAEAVRLLECIHCHWWFVLVFLCNACCGQSLSRLTVAPACATVRILLTFGSVWYFVWVSACCWFLAINREPFVQTARGTSVAGVHRHCSPIWKVAVLYSASHNKWIRFIRFISADRLLSQSNRDFPSNADASRSSFCEKHGN